MRTVLLCSLLLLAMVTGAQRECASTQYRTEQRVRNKALQQQIAAVESFIQKQHPTASTNGTAKMPSGAIRIPVVVHILENGSSTISDERVRDQIEALNRDFRKRNADTSKIPDRFKHLAADIEIEFALATADPKGRATTGIIRKKTAVKQWELDDKIKFSSSGGSNIWDPNSYLNIWVGPMSRVLGYASEPGGPLEADGVVINPSAFGTRGAAAPFNLGRTATHEVGHWLGLIHIWGDEYCGDDLISDTPPQTIYTVGCPSGIRQGCNNDPGGTMYMNYMDFANDACMQLFTLGQKNRMRSLFAEGGFRQSLLNSKGLHAPWSTEPDITGEEEEKEVAVKEPSPPVITTATRVYPNPVFNELVLQTDASWIGHELQLLNMNGLIIQRIRITAKEQKVALGSLLKGVYFLRGQNGEQRINEKIMKL
jgi:Pregnancy-associated plasma protein-A/Secretion system C-terminal sorting domain